MSTCNENSLCCGEECIDCPVDETDSCMQPACDGTSCGKEPRRAGTPCNVNGNFCDGTGFCDGFGSCSVDIRRCIDECNSVTETCVGCNVDDDCIDRVRGNDCNAALTEPRPGEDPCSVTITPQVMDSTCNLVSSECELSETWRDDTPISCNRDDGATCRVSEYTNYVCQEDDTCAQTVAALRTRTDWACEDGQTEPFVAAVCRSSTAIEQRATDCVQESNGRSCGSNSTNWSGICTQTANTCGGTEAGVISAPTCGGGSCASVRTNTSRPCTVANGTTCGAANTTWSGVCTRTANTCGGTEAGVISTPTCGGGACAPVMTNTSRSCNVMNGTSCGIGRTEGPWSECTRSSATDCMGTRSRTATVRTCMTGACQTADETESETCRIPNATSCGAMGACIEDGASENVCIGRATAPVCAAGVCNTGATVPCDRIGFVCDSPDPGICTRSGTGACTGTRSVMTFACAAAGSCVPTTNAPTSCDLPDTATCGSASNCTQGMCDGSGVCTPAVDCSAPGACTPACGGATMCACDGSGACGC